jgi:hypothetical protein
MLACRSATAAASATARGSPPDCVIAPEQLQVSNSPPGRTAASASAFRRLYLIVAAGSDDLSVTTRGRGQVQQRVQQQRQEEEEEQQQQSVREGRVRQVALPPLLLKNNAWLLKHNNH